MVLCNIMLCYTALNYIISCNVVLCCIESHYNLKVIYIISCCGTLCSMTLFRLFNIACVVLYHIMLSYTIFHYIIYHNCHDIVYIYIYIYIHMYIKKISIYIYIYWVAIDSCISLQITHAHSDTPFNMFPSVNVKATRNENVRVGPHKDSCLYARAVFFFLWFLRLSRNQKQLCLGLAVWFSINSSLEKRLFSRSPSPECLQIAPWQSSGSLPWGGWSNDTSIAHQDDTSDFNMEKKSEMNKPDPRF